MNSVKLRLAAPRTRILKYILELYASLFHANMTSPDRFPIPIQSVSGLSFPRLPIRRTFELVMCRVIKGERKGKGRTEFHDIVVSVTY